MDDLERSYRILDLEPGASPDEVRRAWRDLTKVWHPDRFHGDPRMEAKAEEKLKAVNGAYERLKAASAPHPTAHHEDSAAEPDRAARGHEPPRPPRSRTQPRAAGAQPANETATQPASLVRVAPEWGFAASGLTVLVGTLFLTGLANPQWAAAWQLLGVGALLFYLVCVRELQSAVRRLKPQGSWTKPFLSVVLHLIPLLNGYWMFIGWPRELANASDRLKASRLGGLLFLALLGTGLLTQGTGAAFDHGSIGPRLALALFTISMAVLFFVPFGLLSEVKDAITTTRRRGLLARMVVPLAAASAFFLWAAVVWIDFQFDPVQRATELNRQKQFATAEVTLRRRLAKDPSDWRAHGELAASLVGLGRSAEAIQSYREAIRLKPDLFEGHRGLARLLAEDDASVEESVSHFRKALTLRPGDTPATVGLGFSLRYLAEHLRRIQHQEDSRTGADAFDRIIEGKFTKLEQRARDAKTESCSLLQKAVQQDARDAWAHLGAGLCHLDNGRANSFVELELAQKEFQHAVDLAPKVGVARSHLGEAIVRMNSLADSSKLYPKDAAKVEEGLRLLREAVDMEKKNPAVWLNLWGILWDLGRREEWLAVWREGYRAGVMTNPDQKTPATAEGFDPSRYFTDRPPQAKSGSIARTTTLPAPVSVVNVTLGNAVGDDKKVVAPSEVFGVKDNIYASVETAGTGHAKVRALWSFVKGAKTWRVDETTIEFESMGPGVSEFHISKPTAWPKGDYRVEIFLGEDAAPMATKTFKIA